MFCNRRRSRRHVDAERSATAGTLLRLDSPSVREGNPPTHGEPQSGADGTHPRTTHELLEQSIGRSRRQARPAV